MKRIVYLSLLLMVACSQPCHQGHADTDMTTNAEQVLQNRSLAASNLNFYSFEGSEDTKAPRGYKPFYISHYGRHGSRYMDSESEINHVKPVMEMAEKRGLLTQTGKDFVFNDKLVSFVAVIRIDVAEYTAKQRPLPEKMW